MVTLLRAAWVAATLPVVIALIPFSKFSFFQQLVLGFAKRGKIMQSSSNVSIHLKICFLRCIVQLIKFFSVPERNSVPNDTAPGIRRNLPTALALTRE